jgi:Tetratricopeptide repeat
MNGSEHPSIAGSLNNLAALYREMGDYAKAEPLYERAPDPGRFVLSHNLERRRASV